MTDIYHGMYSTTILVHQISNKDYWETAGNKSIIHLKLYSFGQCFCIDSGRFAANLGAICGRPI